MAHNDGTGTSPGRSPSDDLGRPGRDLSQRDGDRQGFGRRRFLGEGFFLGRGDDQAETPESLAEQARRELVRLLSLQGRGATLLTGPRGDTSGRLLRARAMGG